MQLKYNHEVYSMSPVDFMVEFRTSPHTDFCKRYNIVMNDDGSIYDLDLKRKFSCMYNWARSFKGDDRHVQEL